MKHRYGSSYSSELYQSSLDRCVELFLLSEANWQQLPVTSEEEFFFRIRSLGIFDDAKQDLQRHGLFVLFHIWRLTVVD